MTQGDLDRWNAKYMKWKTEQGVSLQGIIPPHDEWLEICAKSMTPASALDLACGLGGNSIWLAKSGWEVTAVDISPVGLDLARQIAANQQVSNISWVAADLDEYYPEKNSFDLVIVFRYLDRTRIPSLAIESLKPGGQIVFETFSSKELTRPNSHIKNPQFTLQPEELRNFFPSAEVVKIDECDRVDSCTVRLLAKKPIH